MSGIKTNMTVMMTYNQLMLAAKAGATYVSLFYNRSKESGQDPVQIIRDYVSTAKEQGIPARLIVGSIRTPEDVATAMAAGAHVMTIPSKILRQMPFSQRSEETIAEFDKAWQGFLGQPPSRDKVVLSRVGRSGSVIINGLDEACSDEKSPSHRWPGIYRQPPGRSVARRRMGGGGPRQPPHRSAL